MMRQLRDPLLDLLKNIAGACGQVSRGERLPEDVTEAESARHMTDSLKMVGCPALGRLSQALGQALDGLANAPARGWSDDHAKLVAGDAMVLAQDLSPVLLHLSEGADILPVALWPRWSQLLSRMNVPVPPPSELFEPAAEFDDLVFERLDPEYLAEVVTGATGRLDRATETLNGAVEDRDVQSFTQSLGLIQEVFDWAGRTHHRRGFQPYWLIVRARLAEARQNVGAHLADPEPICQLVRHGHLELQRFGADARRVGQERLLEDIIPLLGPWSDSLRENPVLTDLRERFNLDGFWAAVSQVTEKKAIPAGQDFEQAKTVLSGLLERVEESWVRWSSAGGDVRDVVRAFAGVVLRSADFPLDEARDLLKAIQVALEWCAMRPTEQDETLNGEVAGGFVALEDTLLGALSLTPGLTDRLRQQTRRLRAVMVPGRVEYQQLPTIRWDTQRMRQETLGARKKTFEQVIKDLSTIESGLEDIMREEVDPKDHRSLLTNMLPALEVGAAVLGLLRLPLHARLMEALAERLDRLSVRPVLLEDVAERQVLAQALPALIGSLEGHAEGRGQDDDDDLLAQVSTALLNEALTGARHAPEWESAEPIVSATVAAVDESSPEPMPDVPAPLSAPAEMPPTTPHPIPEDEDADEDAEENPVASTVHSSAPAIPSSQDVQAKLLSEEGYEDTLDRADPEIAEGFFQEGPEKLADLSGWRHTLLDQPEDADAWDEVRRSFHTLKGSGRFVYLTGVTEVAWWMERFISDQIKAGQPYTPAIDEVVGLACGWFAAAFEELQANQRVRVDGRPIWAAIHGEPEAAAPPGAIQSDANQVTPAEPDQSTSALGQWAQDPEGAEAIQEDLRRRRADLADALADEDLELLERAAHTLRTLANILNLPQWERECAVVERHIQQGLRLSMEEVVDRWMQVIDDLESGQSPEGALETPLDLSIPDLEVLSDDENQSSKLPPVKSEDFDPESLVIDLAPLDFSSDDDVASPASPLPVERQEDEPEVVVDESVSEEEVAPILAIPAMAAPVLSEDVPAPPRRPRTREAIWSDVFASLDMMMEGGRRLGEALAVMRQEEEETDDVGDDPA